MKRPRCRSWCVAGAVALALGGGSDARAQIDSTLVLRLQTNLPESSVFADSVRLGPASLGWYRMPRATREIRLVPNEDHNWSIAPVGAALDSHLPSDTLRLHLDFPYYYRFDSAPFGATVSVGTSSGETQDVGQTPVIFSSNAPLVQPVRFELAGHVPADVAPGRAVWNRHFVELHRVEGAVLAPPDADYRPRTRRKWIDAAALGTAAVGGILAVHFKFKADRLYDEYQETGDPGIRSDIRQYDLYSGVALGAMQVGVGVFVVRLILR